MKKALIFVLTLVPFLAAAQDHLDFFVSPDGSDDASGFVNDPWKTPSLAIARIRDTMLLRYGTGVQLYISGGNYEIEDAISFDGEGIYAPFVVCGHPGEEVTFHGDKAVTGWNRYKGNIWKADLRGCGITDFGEPLGDVNRVDLYRAGKRQTLSRWPNEGFAKAGNAIGATTIPYNEKYDYYGAVEGIMSYTEPRLDKWAKEQDPCASGYWYWDWHEDKTHLTMDRKARTMSMDKPYSPYGYRDGARFYGFNLFCELDAPGEYYIDRAKGLIYWYAPDGVDPNDEAMTLSVFHGESMMTILNAENVYIAGIHFCGARRGAVQITGGRHVTVRACRFNCFGTTAVRLEGGRDHTIDHCCFDEMGCGGIYAVGGDRRTLEPSGFSFNNNTFENFSLYKRTGQPAINVSGCGILVAHNHFESSASSALGLGGNDITVEYNEFFNVVKESDDMGATDTYYDFSFRRLVFRYNHFKDIKGGIAHGAAGVRLDDIISGQIVYGNVFENCGDKRFGAVQIHGGRDNWVSNNLFYNCKYAISFSPWPDEKWQTQFKKQLNKCDAVDCFGPLYRMRYPELNEPAFENHNRNYSTNNLVVNVEDMYRNGDYVSESGNTMVKDSTEPLSYYLKPEVLSSYGLSPIPYSKIGVE